MAKTNVGHKFLHIKMNLQRRLLSAFMMVAVPILIIVFIVSIIIIYSSDRERVYSEQRTTLTSIGRQLEDITEDTKILSKDIIFNDDVQASLISDDFDANTVDTAYFINNFIANRNFVDSVILTKTDETVFSTEHAFTNVSSFQEIQSKSWYPQLQNLEDSYLWVVSDEGLLLTRKIFDLRDYQTLLGYEMIYLSDSYIKDIWSSCDFGNTTNIFLADADGNVLLSNDYVKDPATNYVNKISDADNSSYLSSSYSISNDDWTLYMITPYREVNTNMRILQTQMVVLIIIIMLILLLVSIISASAMAKPINNLAKTMDVFHGEKHPDTLVDISKYHDREDEIGQMYRSYENMTNRMDFMIKDIYIKTLEKRDAELALMQSQINPHFLYNTLDSINWMALANDQEEISEMVMALSDTFRLSLTKNNSSFIKLKDELAYIQSYLVLQKYRYKDKLEVYYDIDESCKELFIPKFICQPIIENALKHGITKLNNAGELFVQAMIQEDILLINVINDGIGVDLEQLQSQLDFDPANMEYLAFENGGYGLQNIHRRIRIICGADYGVSFREIHQEDEPVKTVCTVTLPIKKEENDLEKSDK